MKKQVYFVSLGCPKNRVDTEVMLGLTGEAGFTIAREPESADVIVVNTCGFIGDAKEESVDTILEMARFKEAGSCERLVVTGCLSQRYGGDLSRDMPEVDHFLGSGDVDKIVGAIRGAAPRDGVTMDPAYLYTDVTPRLQSLPHYTAYVKIAEGCDRPCSFCIIPQLRGGQRSRTPESIEKEVRELVERGAVEINLVAQDLTTYGWDVDGKNGNQLAKLVRRLARVDGLRWLRLHYAYPTATTDELIDAVAEEPRVAKYIDMPLQHSDDAILKAMRRGYIGKTPRDLVKKIRERIPGVTLRTTFIVGHPDIPDNIPWKRQEIPEFVETTKKFLETFNITAITSLSVKSAFPLADDLFDLVVIDEASQCDIASALPLILRAKQFVVIGDPMQLKHISKVQNYEEKYIINTLGIDNNLRLDYVNESLYDYCYNLSIASKSHSVFLKEHFRCHPQIITYSNKTFYGPKMGQELDIRTSPDNYRIEPKGIFWINTVGMQHGQRNSNQAEQNKAVELACSLATKHSEISIGITTPFTHQAKEINEAIPLHFKDRIKADTVHRFQGDEKDIMIFSLVVSNNSSKFKAEWINNKVPYLINVAVTRARNTLYIIGNANYCRTLPIDSPLGLLVKYIHDVNPIQN